MTGDISEGKELGGVGHLVNCDGCSCQDQLAGLALIRQCQHSGGRD